MMNRTDSMNVFGWNAAQAHAMSLSTSKIRS